MYDTREQQFYPNEEEPYSGEICDVCGEPILIDSYYWEIEGLTICEDCINDFRHTAYKEF